MSLADFWFLLYNGDEGFQEVAVGKDDYIIINDILFELFFKNYNNETGETTQ